jgi:hypothetical protein
MNDWYPTRDDQKAAQKWDKHLASLKGKNRFDIKMSIGVFDPEFSKTQAFSNFGNLFLSSFGKCQGRELLSFGDWTKGSVENIVTLIKREKTPRHISWLWQNDGRKDFFRTFRGKRLSLELDFSVSTPGSVNVLHYTLKLNDCHITGVGQEFHKIDKSMVKFDRVYAKCDSMEFDSAQ